jgi:hypothetical protein
VRFDSGILPFSILLEHGSYWVLVPNHWKRCDCIQTICHGKRYYAKCMRLLVNDPAAQSSLLDFDLSLDKSLRTLELPVDYILDDLKPRVPDPATLHSLRTVLSTITSPAFPKVVVLYSDGNFRGLSSFVELLGLQSYSQRQQKWQRKPSGTVGCSRCLGKCPRCGTFSWCCVQRFEIQ